MKAVHEVVMNNNCSWDGDECLLYMLYPSLICKFSCYCSSEDI